MTRIVASLTTVPTRYSALRRVLYSLHRQTLQFDAIYLGLPYKLRRTGVDYDELPEDIAKQVTVVRTDDYGPITKIVPAIIHENDPDTIIITFDDDCAYSSDTSSALVNGCLIYPNEVISGSGCWLKHGYMFMATHDRHPVGLFKSFRVHIPEEGRNTDIIMGFSGVAYRRKFFPKFNKMHDEFLSSLITGKIELLMNDDISLSAYLHSRSIKRRVMPNIPIINIISTPYDEETWNTFRTDRTCISCDFTSFVKKFNGALNQVRANGMLPLSESEPVNFTETIAGRIIVSLLIIIAVTCVAIMLILISSNISNRVKNILLIILTILLCLFIAIVSITLILLAIQ